MTVNNTYDDSQSLNPTRLSSELDYLFGQVKESSKPIQKTTKKDSSVDRGDPKEPQDAKGDFVWPKKKTKEQGEESPCFIWPPKKK